MHCRYAVLFLFMLALASAEDEITYLELIHPGCENGYNDSFNVRVLDAKLRPVEGAAVNVTFDRGATFGGQYLTTPTRRTDASGTIHFDLINQGTSSREVDCNILVQASAGGDSNHTTVLATEHGSVVDVPITSIYQVRFYVRDGTNSPLPNATVTLGNFTGTTDAYGLTMFTILGGLHGYLASYLDGGQAGRINVSDDTMFEVMLRASKVAVEVTDDLGGPLPVTLYIFNRTYALPDGKFEYPVTYGSEIPYRVEYQGIVREGSIIPSVSPDAVVTFDTHAPHFGSIVAEGSEGRYSLLIPVSDPGGKASGVNYQSLVVTYRLEPADPATPWNPAVTFTSGKSTLTAEFPELPPGGIVSFRAEISDNAGNKAIVEGRFSTTAPPPPQNITQNQTNTQPDTAGTQGIPLLYIGMGVIVSLFIVYVVFRIKSQGGVSGQ